MEEYLHAREAIVTNAEKAIKATLPRLKVLVAQEAAGTLSSSQAQELAVARATLQQQMAYFELCSDEPGALRASGLVPNTVEYAAYIGAAEAYRLGGDGLGAAAIGTSPRRPGRPNWGA